MDCFPYFELEGSPTQIGEGAGALFGDRIRLTYSFYETFFADIAHLDRSTPSGLEALRASLRKYAESFQNTIKQYLPDFDEEICAVARASGLEDWQVYTLNARTEIYRLIAQQRAKDAPGECTTLYFPKSQLLGQNWDWHPELEKLCIILKIRPRNGPSIVMLTEPGIIGKIGINSEGLGVCLNILFSECEIKGIPIHLILRAILSCSSVAEGVSRIKKLPLGTVSNLLLADAGGEAQDLELKGDQIIPGALPGGELIHTNHFINEEQTASATLPGSINRLKRAQELYAQLSSMGLEGMKSILSDRDNSEFPICRGYAPGLDFMVGTVASIIMDPKQKLLSVVKGQPTSESTWAHYSAF